MKTFELKIYGEHQIVGRGIVFSVHEDDNDIDGIAVGDIVVVPIGKRYTVMGIETSNKGFSKPKHFGLRVVELPDIVLTMGISCGSCIHSNRPKTPRAHAAHYETAKTERWCFKHNMHVTRETTCGEHEGINRSAKSSFTRTKKYNERRLEILDVVKLMGDKILIGRDYEYFVENGWIMYKTTYNSQYSLRSKDVSCLRYLREIRELLNT